VEVAPERTALVLDGHSGQALEVVRSLGRAGWRVLAQAGTRSGASRFTARAIPLPEKLEPGALCAAVRPVFAREQVHLLVPCSDASAQILWGDHAFAEVPILGGDRRSFELASDKAAALAAAELSGFPVPRWRVPRNLGEALRFGREIGLPFVVKPRRSFVPRGGCLVQRRHRFVRRLDELETQIRELGEPDGSLPVLQEYVPGRSLAITAVLRNGHVLAAVARETLSFEPIAGGTSVWKRTIPPGDVGVEMRWLRGEVTRLLTAIDPRSQVPPGISRRAVISRAWPPWRPGMHFDGVDRTDLVPLLPASLRAAIIRLRAREQPAPSRLSAT
jgi:hypothetical protein